MKVKMQNAKGKTPSRVCSAAEAQITAKEQSEGVIWTRYEASDTEGRIHDFETRRNGHFTYQGIADAAIAPLLARTSHFHARGACAGKLQSTMAENTIDFDGVLRAMQKVNYRGFVVLEYVWTEWMDLNRVDNLSETIILRDLLRALEAASLASIQKV